MSPSLPLPLAVRASLALALMRLGEELVAVASGLWEISPGEDSRTLEMLGDRPLGDSDFADVTISVAAASDEFNAFAWVLGGDGPYGPSLGSLVRSCVETLGRAWWLMDAGSSSVLAHRAAVLSVDEARYLARNGGVAATRGDDGEIRTLRGNEIEQAARERLASVRVEGLSASAPGYRELATALLAAVNSPNPGLDYSQMSGAAHGERMTLASFGNERPGHNGVARIGLDLPSGHAQLYIWILLHATDRVMVTLFEMWGDPGEELHRRWARAIQTCFHTVEPTFRAVMQ